jgi:hypothetical protein
MKWSQVETAADGSPAGQGSPADGPEQPRRLTVLAEDDTEPIERSGFFFLASTDADGRPECSYPGGLSGFVRVADATSLAFPCYDGDGMYRSLNNIRLDPKVGLPFIDPESARRLRMIGTASNHGDDAPLKDFFDAQLVFRIQAAHVFPSRTRHIHRRGLVEDSDTVRKQRRG